MSFCAKSTQQLMYVCAQAKSEAPLVVFQWCVEVEVRQSIVTQRWLMVARWSRGSRMLQYFHGSHLSPATYVLRSTQQLMDVWAQAKSAEEVPIAGSEWLFEVEASPPTGLRTLFSSPMESVV